MKGRRYVVIIGRPAVAAATASILLTLFCSPAHAQTAPRPGCVAVSKGEYDSASRTNRLQNRVGSYVRTRKLWRRHYWYCKL